MDAYHFTEMPYPDIPPHDQISSMRVNLPNKHFDPVKGKDLYNRYLDEYVIADELGLDIMLNEHHSSIVCIDVAGPLTAAILARQTKRARILILGNPVANRDDPIRIAEEMAMVDCISGGRLECGMVRGVTYEIFAANTNPTQTNERLWEGVDMVIKAWTIHDGPFNYEGRFWHRRSINIWPRPYQQPRPRIWITGSSDRENVKRVAQQGHVFATFLLPHEKARALFDIYREHYAYNGVPGGMAFMPLVYTADSEAEAAAGAEELAWYLRTIAEPQFKNPPGYVGIDLNVQALKGAFESRSSGIRMQGLDYLREQGIVIFGTPDSVAAQIKRLHERVGGFDHLLMMQQAGFLSHQKTVKSMTLFAKEVYPQIRELPPSECNRGRSAEPQPERAPHRAADSRGTQQKIEVA
jgi:alkanesulfonate monooxygenase SsuD/methylene tetrahydromethanopterin reductase-like flavin-dependent oxidoreductase (luciferase family)